MRPCFELRAGRLGHPVRPDCQEEQRSAGQAIVTLLLVRHGQTEWNLQHRTQGQKDSPLTEKGKRQADRAGKALSCHTVHRFYCSDSGRAVQTAERIRAATPKFPPPRREPRLRELNYGDWEGLLHDEIIQEHPQLYAVYRNDPASFRAPNGESFMDLQARFSSFLAELPMADGETILVVSHAGLLRVAILTLVGKTIAEMRSIPSLPEASISILRLSQGSWTMAQSCDTRHLENLDA